MVVQSQFIEMTKATSSIKLEDAAKGVFAGGDKPKDYSAVQGELYKYPVFSNGIGDNALLCFSKECRVKEAAITVSARGTIGYAECRAAGFTPVVRLLTLIPKDGYQLSYLKFALNNVTFHSTGSSQGQLTAPDFCKYEIPNAPKDVQLAFESIVHQADKSKFDGLKSQFIEETKLWENEGTIRDLIHNTVEKAGKKYSADSKIRYIDISSVDNETNTVTGVTEYIFKDAPSRAQQCVKKGDILVSTVRPNLKNIAVNHLDGEDLVASSGFCVLRPKEGCAGLIMAYILSDVFTEKMTLVAKGTNYPAIHDSDILNYKIRLSDDSKVSMIDRLFRQADKSKYLS